MDSSQSKDKRRRRPLSKFFDRCSFVMELVLLVVEITGQQPNSKRSDGLEEPSCCPGLLILLFVFLAFLQSLYVIMRLVLFCQTRSTAKDRG